MKKSYVINSIFVASLTVLAVSTVFIGNSGNANFKAFGTQVDNYWNHYSRIEPTETTHGSKEFWTSCSTHEFVLEQPDGVEIREGVAFNTTSYFNEMDLTDARYLPSVNEQKSLGMIPVINGNTLTYGYYPQVAMSSGTSITTYGKKITSTKYYYNGNYYVKVKESSYGNNIYYDNGVKVSTNYTWFKYQPITWKILNIVNSNQYLLLSERVLEYTSFYGDTSDRTIDETTIHPNNYLYSDVRTWLNNDFFNSAFQMNNSYFKYLNVSSPSTSIVDEESATTDKITLPSTSDLSRSAYGFVSVSNKVDTARQAVTTDWARGHAAYNNALDGYVGLYHGEYATRTASGSDKIYTVGEDGKQTAWLQAVPPFDMHDVRPMIAIQID